MWQPLDPRKPVMLRRLLLRCCQMPFTFAGGKTRAWGMVRCSQPRIASPGEAGCDHGGRESMPLLSSPEMSQDVPTSRCRHLSFGPGEPIGGMASIGRQLSRRAVLVPGPRFASRQPRPEFFMVLMVLALIAMWQLLGRLAKPPSRKAMHLYATPPCTAIHGRDTEVVSNRLNVVSTRGFQVEQFRSAVAAFESALSSPTEAFTWEWWMCRSVVQTAPHLESPDQS